MGGARGGAAALAPSFPSPTWALPAPTPHAPPLGLLPATITEAIPLTGAPPSSHRSVSMWTL